MGNPLNVSSIKLPANTLWYYWANTVQYYWANTVWYYRANTGNSILSMREGFRKKIGKKYGLWPNGGGFLGVVKNHTAFLKKVFFISI